MTETILISKREAAKALSISVRTLDNLIAAKELAVRRVGRRCLISRRTLEEFAKRDHGTRPYASGISQIESKEDAHGNL